MKKGRILALSLALLMLCTVFSGCSKKLGYRTVAEIKKSGEIVLLTNAQFEPYEYIAGGQPVGADIDLAQMIADNLGVKLKIIDMDFDGLVDALKSGKGDFIAAGMANNPERALIVDFSIEYVRNGLMIIVPVGSDIKGPDDLAGKRIAVQEGTTSDAYVTDDVAGSQPQRYKDIVVAGSAVSDGRADACVLDIKPAEGVVANSNGKLVLLPDLLSEESMSMAVGKGNAELLTIINGILTTARADGTVDELVQKHMDLTTAG